MYSWWLCSILTAWIHGVWLVAMTYVYDSIHLWSEHGNAYLRTGIIFCRCLVVYRFPIRCAPCFWHTHAFYKVFRLSQVLASYFGGHSVTHYFGHSGDVSTMMCSSSHKEFFPEKSDWFLPLQNLFLEGHRRLGIIHSAEMPDLCRLSLTWLAKFPQDSL